MNQIQENRTDLMNKLGVLDMMLESLAKIHKDDSEKVEELMKKFSTRKLILMEELYRLLSSVTL